MVKSKRILKACISLLLASASGCSSLGLSAEAKARLAPPHVLHLDLPYEAQAAPDLCGIAAVDMVAGYYKQPLGHAAIDGMKDEAEATGAVSGTTLKLVLEEAGYAVFVFAGSLSHDESGLYHHLDLQRPLLVMTGSKPRHFEVVVGYDEGASLVMLLDPALGSRTVPAQDFMADWKEANYFTMLATPDAKGKN